MNCSSFLKNIIHDNSVLYCKIEILLKEGQGFDRSARYFGKNESKPKDQLR